MSLLVRGANATDQHMGSNIIEKLHEINLTLQVKILVAFSIQ